MVCQMLVSLKIFTPFIRLANYAFARDDITYCKCVPNTTFHGQIVQYPEIIVTQLQNPGN